MLNPNSPSKETTEITDLRDLKDFIESMDEGTVVSVEMEVELTNG